MMIWEGSNSNRMMIVWWYIAAFLIRDIELFERNIKGVEEAILDYIAQETTINRNTLNTIKGNTRSSSRRRRILSTRMILSRN